MNLLLQRGPTKNGDFTPGELFIDGEHECWTCEDIVREIPGVPVATWKIKGQTAIPAGRYRVILDQSARFKCEMPHILDVPGFDGVRIHWGNTAADTEGCLLLGLQAVATGVAASKRAFDGFIPKLAAALQGGGECWIGIVNVPQVVT